MSAISAALPGRSFLIRPALSNAAAIRTSALAANEQTGNLSFAKSGATGVDAEANVGAVGLANGTTKLSLAVDLQANRKYSFSFYYNSGGPRVSLVDSHGKRTSVNMKSGFTVTKGGSYTLVFEAGYSLKTAGFDTLKVKGTSLLPTTSGDKKIDALLRGGTAAWWHPFDAAPTRAATKVSPTATGLDDNSSAHTLTYSFLTAPPTGQEGMSNFQEMTTAQKDAVRRAFDHYSKLLNLTFTEATDGTGVINLGTNTQASSAGYATLPNISGEKDKAYLYLANNQSSNDDSGVQAGGYGWLTILHELGHTLGLKHPGNYNASGGGTPGPYLPSAEDNHQFSMMAYSDDNATRGVNATTPMLYDVAALQYLYGANQDGTTATDGAFTFTAGHNYLQTLWSANGTDTIDLSQVTNANAVNLNAGTFSSINITGPATSTFYSGNKNVAIAYGSKINNVTLSSTTGMADSVTLNNAYAAGDYDTVGSFDASADKILLRTGLFGKLSMGNIEVGTVATKATSKIIVNPTTGEIFYDADGNKTKSVAKKIAQVSLLGGGALAARNFSFVA
jgi:hypothetical protein